MKIVPMHMFRSGSSQYFVFAVFETKNRFSLRHFIEEIWPFNNIYFWLSTKQHKQSLRKQIFLRECIQKQPNI